MATFCGQCGFPPSTVAVIGGVYYAAHKVKRSAIVPKHFLSRLPALACAAVLAMLAFTTPALAAAGGGGGWISNGATACEKYLTPDVVAAILRTPAGHPRRLDVNSCNAGMIYIFLKVADINVFRMELPRIAGVHLISGVGDGAYWNEAGALSAVKGHDRGCNISIIGAPGELKIHDAALGQKLGEICNKLFAIP
jgi:hypothetical protein